MKKLHFETLAIHEGQAPDEKTGAVITPIYQTSTYAQESPGIHKGYEYSRTHNPTRKAFEECMAALENGSFASAFSSGMGAITTLLHLLDEGAHVICSDDAYGGTYRLFTKILAKRNFKFSFIDLSNEKALIEAITPHTKMIWVETPTNPLLKIVDLEKISTIAKARNILVVVDNTFASSYLQKPLDFGADIVMHSTTKYLGGHSDVVGGITVVRDKGLADQISFLQNAMGAVPGPMDAWLTLRGLKTLSLRMDRHCQNAMKIAEFLSSHPSVKKVIYPGLENHPQHALAKKQMGQFGGMISAVLNCDLTQTKKFLSKLKLFCLAESLGGVESLIEHPAIMTHASIPAIIREQLGITDGFIRLSVGIEHIDDLKEDLASAFKNL